MKSIGELFGAMLPTGLYYSTATALILLKIGWLGREKVYHEQFGIADDKM